MILFGARLGFKTAPDDGAPPPARSPRRRSALAAVAPEPDDGLRPLSGKGSLDGSLDKTRGSLDKTRGSLDKTRGSLDSTRGSGARGAAPGADTASDTLVLQLWAMGGGGWTPPLLPAPSI